MLSVFEAEVATLDKEGKLICRNTYFQLATDAWRLDSTLAIQGRLGKKAKARDIDVRPSVSIIIVSVLKAMHEEYTEELEKTTRKMNVPKPAKVKKPTPTRNTTPTVVEVDLLLLQRMADSLKPFVLVHAHLRVRLSLLFLPSPVH